MGAEVKVCATATSAIPAATPAGARGPRVTVERMTKSFRDPSPPLPSCPLCGCTTFVEGKVRGQGVVFVPDDAGLLSSVFAMGFGMRARKREACNNVQPFASGDE